MSLPAIVEDTVETYLASVDAEAPGLIEGLYLEGSLALNDFRPDASDIDFVAVTANRRAARSSARSNGYTPGCTNGAAARFSTGST
ncbi:nucleotidyltransferase domain-containing protein [Nocardia sp. NPDC051052]|uniref:nucleotidyltransferase domain-containing protein n=1 Tax=Nocardia sp. NPDC051052 TaxID=3364322 RepID=UPI003789692A